MASQPLLRRSPQMNSTVWHKAAAISGMLAVGLGAYGAHGFKPKNLTYQQVWQTASLYHLVHTAALLAAPITNHPQTFGGLMSAGIVLFSGSCYAAALMEDRKYSALAPVGGIALIAGWTSLLF